MDILLGADEDLVKFEMDLYWVAKAGKDPITELQRLSGNVPLVHIKDMSEDGDFRPVGDGIIDYKGSVLQAAVDAGAQGFIVEQDQCSTHTPLESIARSITALRNWGFAS
jgi:sugar phosphate isomerase/epimerase